MIVFRLTMPSVNTWNGKWSGEDQVYARCRENRYVPAEIVGRDFFYRWDDGWEACVSVRKMDSREARKIMRKSNGFRGYDWMIDSLIKDGYIHTLRKGKGNENRVF